MTTIELTSPEVAVEVTRRYLPRPLPAGHKSILISHTMWEDTTLQEAPYDRRIEDCTEPVDERTDLCSICGANGPRSIRRLRHSMTSPGMYITRQFVLTRFYADVYAIGATFHIDLRVYVNGEVVWGTTFAPEWTGPFSDNEFPIGIYAPPGATVMFELVQTVGTVAGWAEGHCAAWEIQYWQASLSLSVDKEKVLPGEELTFSGRLLVKEVGQAGIDVFLYRGETVEATATTAADGSYSIKVKAPTEIGTYKYHTRCVVVDEPQELGSPEVTVEVVEKKPPVVPWHLLAVVGVFAAIGEGAAVARKS